MLLAADQAVVTLNGGQTWSSWYNSRPQQLSRLRRQCLPVPRLQRAAGGGSACVSSRERYGAVSVRDWLPVGVDEYGYVAPDPLNPDVVQAAAP